MNWSFRDKVIWTAAFLEGEGSFSIKRMRYHGGFRFYPTLHATQTDLEPLHKLQDWWGGRVGLHSKKGREMTGGKYIQNKDLWAWRVEQQAVAAGIMMMVYPFVRVSIQNKIKAVLDECKEWKGRSHVKYIA